MRRNYGHQTPRVVPALDFWGEDGRRETGRGKTTRTRDRLCCGAREKTHTSPTKRLPCWSRACQCSLPGGAKVLCPRGGSETALQILFQNEKAAGGGRTTRSLSLPGARRSCQEGRDFSRPGGIRNGNLRAASGRVATRSVVGGLLVPLALLCSSGGRYYMQSRAAHDVTPVGRAIRCTRHRTLGMTPYFAASKPVRTPWRHPFVSCVRHAHVKFLGFQNERYRQSAERGGSTFYMYRQGHLSVCDLRMYGLHVESTASQQFSPAHHP